MTVPSAIARRLSGGTLGRAILARAGGTFAARCITAGLNFAVAILLARVMAPEDYGHFILLAGFAALAATLSTFGLPTLLLREIAGARASKKSAQPGAVVQLAMLLIAILALYPLGLPALPLLDLDLRLPWTIMLAGVPISFAVMVGVAVLMGHERVLAAQLSDGLVRPLVLVVCLLVTLGAGQRLGLAMGCWLALAAACASLLVVGVQALPLLRKTLPPFAGVHSIPTYSVMLGVGIWLAAGQALVNITTQIDIFMLGWLAGPHEIGEYYAAARGAQILALVFGAVTLSLGPTIARLLASGDHRQLQHLLTTTSRQAFAIIALAGITLVLLGRHYLSMFGDGFVDAYPTLVVITLGWIAGIAFGPVLVLANMGGQHRWGASVVGIGLAADVLLNLLLIPLWGALGASIAFLGVAIIPPALLWLRCRAVLGLRTDVFGPRHGTPRLEAETRLGGAT